MDIRQWRQIFFSLGNEVLMESTRSCCWPKQSPSLRSILLSLIGLWVKIWHRKKTAGSELNPVQSSWSKSTSCLRKGRLHSDFRWQRAKAFKLKWCLAWFWMDCNQGLQPNRLQMKCDVWKPCSDQRWQDKLHQFEYCWSICLCKHLSTVLLTNHP